MKDGSSSSSIIIILDDRPSSQTPGVRTQSRTSMIFGSDSTIPGLTVIHYILNYVSMPFYGFFLMSFSVMTPVKSSSKWLIMAWFATAELLNVVCLISHDHSICSYTVQISSRINHNGVIILSQVTEVGWLHGAVVELGLWPANFPCAALDLQLTGDHLCG